MIELLENLAKSYEKGHKFGDVDVVNSWGFLYFTGVKLRLNAKDVKEVFPSYLIVIKSCKETQEWIRMVNNERDLVEGNNQIIPLDIMVYNSHVDIELLERDKVLIINKELFSRYEGKYFPEGMHLNPHHLAISSLFDTIDKGEERLNELLAIANLAVIPIKSKLDSSSTFDQLKKTIENYQTDSNFCLDLVCRQNYISRRKAQYIFNSQSTTFVDLVKDIRVHRLKEEIHKSNGAETIESYVYKSGFHSRTRANVIFREKTGMTIKDYIMHCRNCCKKVSIAN
ncbi:hypothetical protein ACOMICROBIO_GDFFDHBD_03005 [Vibrio sp. B1REV9]|uniref:helix-turn-helix domain-containing protein n=1 Tax=Vibrio sp. B1REV9 TaxID=2751179 RepID=UPI001AF5317C|nr:AraC family transcriptional regulator [Vibrio sp. B1REV9]CAE6937757.1 hypothetical protein ACOMICROBIO_GDFFDHBD_03005 [Vibrio sp. B1REV9]